MAALKALGAVGAIGSLGLGILGMGAQANASSAQALAQTVDRESARQATILEYEKLDITIDQLTRQAGVVTGLVGSAIAGAGAEITSGVSAQARAITFSALARDIEVSRLNADIAATRLGFGPSTGGPEGEKAVRGTSRLSPLQVVLIQREQKRQSTVEKAAAEAAAAQAR